VATVDEEVNDGPAFLTSPKPIILPLPQFPIEKAVAAMDD
jgi:hypothetical protein